MSEIQDEGELVDRKRLERISSGVDRQPRVEVKTSEKWGSGEPFQEDGKMITYFIQINI